MTHQTRAADVLAQRLYQAGCRHAFGMPGGEVLTLVDALDRAGIEFVLVKHENAAGFMAEAVWARTGAPGILVATLGPGALNGINSVGNAHQDRVPLIVLTGCVDEDEAQTYTHQVLDHAAVFAPLTKASLRLSAGSADVIADKAVTIATEPRPGPVHVDVPISVAAADAPPPSPFARRQLAAPAAPAGPDLDTARAWLAEADRPIIVVGLDALNEGAGAAVQDFAEAHGVPFVTTYRAKGIVDESHPLCLGGAGLSPLADATLVPLVQSADLILTLGYDPIEMRPGWRNIWDASVDRVIEIAPVPNHHYMHQSSLTFQAGVAESLQALSAGVAPRATWPGQEPQAAKAALARAFPADADWGPGAIVATARATLPPETIATVDSGAHRILLSQMWSCPGPRSLLQSSALCTMGCAIPLALGAAMVDPDRPVVAFTGDAGFLMVAGELATAQERGLKPIIVVFVDASLALIELKQRQRQLPNRAVDFARHDYAAIGLAFGGHGVTVSDRDGLQAALSDALTADRFTVIAAIFDREAYDGRI
ncbi:thiamine pyrophosphate-binding protein [Fluviibacterium sp. DFM31]|uniref:Thiamine pyrophosphate-binding protein n=1 Tax=Meridianimarinicoccus marinus TaxID=3231483 RepID=A0ABV3L8A1_9RHOB